MTTNQECSRRFLYFYFHSDQTEKIRRAVPEHVQYWRSAGLKGYLGGPFSDRSGGLISFLAASLQEAEDIISQDPFQKEVLITQMWIKEWVTE